MGILLNAFIYICIGIVFSIIMFEFNKKEDKKYWDKKDNIVDYFIVTSILWPFELLVIILGSLFYLYDKVFGKIYKRNKSKRAVKKKRKLKY